MSTKITDTEMSSDTIAEAPRANRHGSVCPAWCDIDHAKPVYSGERPIDTHISATMASGRGCPRVLLTQFSAEFKVDSQPEIQFEGTGGFVAVSAGMAESLAGLVESLADCTPERLRDLADEIRVAASILTAGDL